MDVVLSRLQNTNISPHEADNNKTNFDSLYKNWGKLGNQDERRKEILGVQKSNRNSNVDKFRGIMDLVQAVEEDSIFKTQHRAYYRPSIYVAGFNKVPTYSQVLMMSEWMVEKPSDFETHWLVVPSPRATRTLVVACNGSTRLFTKHGHLLFECRTALPGGNPCDIKSNVNCCVLDGFYQKKGDILYVLDILAWNSQPMTDGELEFRDYWLRSQFFELDDLRVLSKKNELSFKLLPKVSCDPEMFGLFMRKLHFDKDFSVLDGLLFFHKNGHYQSGETPLVGWLYPYMVPEVLGSDIVVNPAYMLQKPTNYTNQADFITEFNAKMEKKSKGKDKSYSRRSINKMDTTEVIKNETKKHKEVKKISKKNDKPRTESMEAEAAPDSADEAASVLATVYPETEAIGAKTSSSIWVDPDTLSDMDAETTEKK